MALQFHYKLGESIIVKDRLLKPELKRLQCEAFWSHIFKMFKVTKKKNVSRLCFQKDCREHSGQYWRQNISRLTKSIFTNWLFLYTKSFIYLPNYFWVFPGHNLKWQTTVWYASIILYIKCIQFLNLTIAWMLHVRLKWTFFLYKTSCVLPLNVCMLLLM